MRRSWIFLVALVAVLLSAPSARANGRFPASNAVVFDPRDPKAVIVRATFGLLVTRDGGDSWRWICERAIGFSGMEDPTYTVTPKGTLVGGTFSGIAVSRDGGCTFDFAGGPGAHVLSDLAMRPDGAIVGITSVYAKAGDGGSLYDNHLVVSKDDAQSFAVAGGPIDPTLLIESIEVTPSDPVRLYMSAVRGEGDKRTAAFLVSYDDGMSWVERRFDLVGGETAPFIANVDPNHADRVYVRTAGPVDAQTRLLVTDDAGKSWKKVLDSASPLLGFALSPDGKRVFAGAREGLWSSPTDTFAFTKGSSAEVQCLGASGALLWACSTERSGFVVGASRGTGRSFDAKLHLEEIKGPLECPPSSSVAKQCTAEWPKLRRELGLPEEGEMRRNAGPSGPALRGRAERTGRARGGFAAVAAVALLGIAGYTLLKRLRRGR
ncbi:MAG: hypothetical protein KF795_31335 [Labilithrix sp.]|nr:hypothetical protein [Labilithrix sp.]